METTNNNIGMPWLGFGTLAARALENYDISSLPEDAIDEITRIQTRTRFNQVVTTGVPGFISKGN